MKNSKDYEKSSGNVFADLGFANPEEMLAKSELARQINNLIEQKKLTQKRAAALLEIDQPKISDLSNGKLSAFSLERLFRFLNMLGQVVTIKVSAKTRAKPTANVIVSIPKIKRTPIAEQRLSPGTTTPKIARKKNN